MARTIEFDRSEVLDKSVSIFWESGYCKTSISDLVEATSLKPGSIYAAFKSKEGLFIASLNHYGNKGAMLLRDIINKAETPLEGIKQFFMQILGEINDNNKGCFLVNTILEVSPHELTIKNEVNKHLAVIESILFTALELALEKNELPNDASPKDLVKFLMINIWGIRVLARTNPSNETIDAIQKQLFLSFEV